MTTLLIKEIVEKLSPVMDSSELEEGIRKLEDHCYGPYALLSAPDSGTLIIGAGFAVSIFAYAHFNTGTSIFVVEEQSAQFEQLKKWMAVLNLQNLSIYNSLAACLDAIASTTSNIGVVGVHRDFATIDTLLKLEPLANVNYLFGEFSEDCIDIMQLYEISRAKADKFHWYNLTVNLPIIGCRSDGPLLSVVVPAYGVENYLDQCLTGLVAQSLESYEVIVVDDGAKDRSGEIADQWANNDARVRVIHQQNTGCAGARSNGLHQTTGVFVGFVDGDDWVEPGMCEALLVSALRYNSDIAQCGYKEFHQSEGSFRDIAEKYDFSRTDSEGSGLVNNPKSMLVSKPTIWRRIYRREFLADNAIDFAIDLPRFDDLPFQFISLGLAERISVVPGHYYCYRQQRPGQDVSVDDERLFVHFPIFKYLRKFLQEHYSPTLERELKRVQIATHFWGSSRIRSELMPRYLQAAGYDIFGQNISLSTRNIFLLIRRSGKLVGLWLLKVYMNKSKGQDLWKQLQDYNG